MLTIAGGLLELIRFSIAINPPNVVVVSAQLAIRMAASGAAALAHSASRMASASFGGMIPGSLQLFAPLAGAGWTLVNEAPAYVARPKAARKLSQSAGVKTFVSSIRTMV